MEYERIILIKGKTRLESLLERFNSRAQSKFYIEHNGGNFSQYENEHDNFYKSYSVIQKKISASIKSLTLDREYVSSFLFDKTDLVVVVGKDGLVANTAKYVGDIPLMAINPDSSINAGVLLPFDTENFHVGFSNILNGVFSTKQITMAKATMNDGQELLAFNDFFLGKSDHTSANYKIKFGGKEEIQSSSGMIISTGAGSTGWLSSVVNEFNGLFQFFGNKPLEMKYEIGWDDNRLCFIVREPYKSPGTDINIIAGVIDQSNNLIIESTMPENGVIFSDGIASDYLSFNAGSTITIGLAKTKANLIIN